MINILITRGLGFIGSHTCVSLQECLYRLIIDSNIRFANEIIIRLKKIGTLKKLDFSKRIFFLK